MNVYDSATFIYVEFEDEIGISHAPIPRHTEILYVGRLVNKEIDDSLWNCKNIKKIVMLVENEANKTFELYSRITGCIYEAL